MRKLRPKKAEQPSFCCSWVGSRGTTIWIEAVCLISLSCLFFYIHCLFLHWKLLEAQVKSYSSSYTLCSMSIKKFSRKNQNEWFLHEFNLVRDFNSNIHKMFIGFPIMMSPFFLLSLFPFKLIKLTILDYSTTAYRSNGDGNWKYLTINSINKFIPFLNKPYVTVLNMFIQ